MASPHINEALSAEIEKPGPRRRDRLKARKAASDTKEIIDDATPLPGLASHWASSESVESDATSGAEQDEAPGVADACLTKLPTPTHSPKVVGLIEPEPTISSVGNDIDADGSADEDTATQAEPDVFTSQDEEDTEYEADDPGDDTDSEVARVLLPGDRKRLAAMAGYDVYTSVPNKRSKKDDEEDDDIATLAETEPSTSGTIKGNDSACSVHADTESDEGESSEPATPQKKAHPKLDLSPAPSSVSLSSPNCSPERRPDGHPYTGQLRLIGTSARA